MAVTAVLPQLAAIHRSPHPLWAADVRFHICSHAVMIRVADDILSTHLEVALATASPSLLDGLVDRDQRHRHAAVGEIARHLVERLRCFDIWCEDAVDAVRSHPTLFSAEVGPIG